MIKPDDLSPEVWDTISAAAAGDAAALTRLFERDPNLHRAGYWYALPIDFAVREGHLDAVHVLLEAGADPAAVSFWGEDLVTVARDRGHEAVARLLEQVCGRDSRGRAHPYRKECAAIFLDAGAILSARDENYRSTPLAWAARDDLPDMVEFLLTRGAPTRLPDDEPWATPLAWATRRGHGPIADILRRAGATS